MSGNERDYRGAARERPPRELSLAEVAEGAVHKFVTVLVIAAALIALAIYARPAPPRYQAVVGDGKVVRIDTRSGTMIACEAERCFRILKSGQILDRNPRRAALPKQEPAAAPQALPAPATAPAPAPAPAPAAEPDTE